MLTITHTRNIEQTSMIINEEVIFSLPALVTGLYVWRKQTSPLLFVLKDEPNNNQEKALQSS